MIPAARHFGSLKLHPQYIGGNLVYFPFEFITCSFRVFNCLPPLLCRESIYVMFIGTECPHVAIFTVMVYKSASIALYFHYSPLISIMIFLPSLDSISRIIEFIGSLPIHNSPVNSSTFPLNCCLFCNG
jgi:hypothetical protein